MINFWNQLIQTFRLSDLLDILLVTLILYFLFKFLRGTRSVQVIQGLVFLIIVMLIISVIATNLRLNTISWILDKFWAAFIVAMVVIFAPEIRRGFTQFGQKRFFRRFFRAEEQTLIEIVQAVTTFSKRKIGSLIVIERETNLGEYIQQGVEQDSKVIAELLISIFMPYSPLHDGAVIIQGNRIVSAGVLLPLSQQTNLSRELGSRHYAALGITEETDAAVIVVSEETGTISFARNGELTRGLDGPSLRKILRSLYGFQDEASES